MASRRTAKKQQLMHQAGKHRARRVRAVEASLREANARLHQQIELYELTEVLTGVGHWVYQPGDAQPRWSKGIHAIVGTGSRKMESASMSLDHIHPDDRPRFMAAMQAMDGNPIEYRAYSAAGFLGWFRTRAIGRF